MACGVPVIASAAGGIPEVVENDKTGFLAPPGDVTTMAQRALEVLVDSALHERLKRNAAARALEFSADKVVPRYEALYEEVLSSSRPPACSPAVGSRWAGSRSRKSWCLPRFPAWRWVRSGIPGTTSATSW